MLPCRERLGRGLDCPHGHPLPGTQSMWGLPASPVICPLGEGGVHWGPGLPQDAARGREGRGGWNRVQAGRVCGQEAVKHSEVREVPETGRSSEGSGGSAVGPLSSLACVQTKTSVSKRQVSAVHAHAHAHTSTHAAWLGPQHRQLPLQLPGSTATVSSPKRSPGVGGRQPARGRGPGLSGQVEALGNQGRGIHSYQEHPKT